MSQERRIHTRIATRLPARLRQGADTVEGVIENIGQGGVFFATDVLEVAVEEGAGVSVEFSLRRAGVESPVRMDGTVLRTERYFDGQAVVRAFAIRFEGLLDLAGADL